MNLILKLSIIIVVLMSFPAVAFANNSENTLKITLYKQPSPNNGSGKWEEDSEGRRTPSSPILCTISKTCGVSIYGNEYIIISYELWDESNTICIASFSEDTPFCQYLFNVPGLYIIKILTEDYIYIGTTSTTN